MQPDSSIRMNASFVLRRAAAATFLACSAFAAASAFAQAKTVLRISTPAVPDDCHVKMLYVFRDELATAAPGRFDVQVHRSGTLFRQRAERVALKLCTIAGPDTPLPTLQSAKFSEVTRQIVLTGHLVDVLQLAMSAKTWNALSAAHRAQVKRAAAKAAKFNAENRALEERELIEFFRSQGIEITTPDVEAFRKTVQAAYLKSEFAQKWPRGLLERINAVK